MSLYTVTVDVHDLEPSGPVPANAELRIWRDQPAVVDGVAVSTRQHAIPVGGGPTSFTVTAGVVYWAEFTGVAGWETPFAFLHNADTSFGDLYLTHQVNAADYSTAPVATSVAASIADVSALAASKASVIDNGDGTATLT